MTAASSRVRWGRRVAAALFLVAAILLVRPICHLTAVKMRDLDEREPVPAGFADDVSRLSRTAVREVWSVPADREQAERELSALLGRARAEGLPVSIAGARHSMGGHTIAPGGIVIDMTPLRNMQYDEATGRIRVESGATWSEVLRHLNPRGRSVRVMQAFSSFTIGGSLSVNGHGWQHDQPPISSSVVSVRLLRADGALVRLSRTEEPEWFALVLGGYGLFGIILEAELETVPDERYRHERVLIPTARYLEAYAEQVVRGRNVRLSYGRLRVDSSGFLEDAILNRFILDESGDASPLPLGEPGLARLQRAVFRGSQGSEYGKKLRWDAETRLEEYLTERISSRNQLLYYEVEPIANRSSDTTDLLHEYFLPESSFHGFVAAMQEIIPRHGGDLLNVTVRNVAADRDSYLRYAETDVFAFVLLFTSERSEAGEARMQAMTRELVDSCIRLRGRFYLPYRLHYTREQLHAAYPQARAFFAAKRRLDPEERFQNQFYRTYGR